MKKTLSMIILGIIMVFALFYCFACAEIGNIGGNDYSGNINSGSATGESVNSGDIGGNESESRTEESFERGSDDKNSEETGESEGKSESERQSESESETTSESGSEETKKLGSPENLKLNYDTIEWDAVDNADFYTVRVNGDFEYVLRNNACPVSNLKNRDGETITTVGNLKIYVWANGYDDFEDSDKAYCDEKTFYIPSIKSDKISDLEALSIGYGYNLIESPYYNNLEHLPISVFDLGKLLSIGSYAAEPASESGGMSYNYRTVDEFISNTSVAFNYSSEIGCTLIGSIKKEFSASAGLDYKSYSYNDTFVYKYNRLFKDYNLKINGAYLWDDIYKYCLSSVFKKDIENLKNNPSEENLKIIYQRYGTHAVLGVTTGGSYTAQYTVSTNNKDVAAQVKASFNLSTGGGAIDQVIQKNIGLGIDVSENLSFKNSETEAHFEMYTIGGNGGLTTSATGVEAALKQWGESFKEENARPIRFSKSKDSAIAISSVISCIDVNLGKKYEDYINSKTDEAYKELFGKYTKKTDIPVSVDKDKNGKNVVTIDLSAYQSSGTVDGYYPNFVDGVFTVYPTMNGKHVDIIKIIGGLNEDGIRLLMNGFALEFTKRQYDPVMVIFENLGMEYTYDTGSSGLSGIVDENRIDEGIVSTEYEGLNIFKKTNGNYIIRNGALNISCVVSDEEVLDLSSVRIKDGLIQLPVGEKRGYAFKGWYDADNVQVSDKSGNVDEEYAKSHNLTAITLHCEWEQVYVREGNYIYFGSYPQAKVTDASLVSSLNTLAGALPTSENAQKWTSYKYYIEGEIKDYMWYQDIEYAESKYRGVYFTSYRPYYCHEVSDEEHSSQDDNGYKINTVYWFKYEKIKWRILNDEGNIALLLSDIALDNQHYYHNNDEIRTINGKIIYANNYEESDVRKWLQNDFYNMFTRDEKGIVKKTGLDNSSKTANPYGKSQHLNNGVNGYTCNKTSDKFFLLSLEDATNKTYGFTDLIDTNKESKISDYASAQGTECVSTMNGCVWYLRSPSYQKSYFVSYINGNGYYCIDSHVDDVNNGIRPAVRIDL